MVSYGWVRQVLVIFRSVLGVRRVRVKNMNLSNRTLREQIAALPGLRMWQQEIDRLFPVEGDVVRLDWQLPAIGCQSLGADPKIAIPAMAALACIQISIILVDDMLDEEPDGEYRRMGAGRAANLALALQSAAMVLVDRCPVSPAQRSAAARCLAQMCLDTAAGQELDVSNLEGEENYWRVVQAKSTPFYGAGIQLGAILGGGDPNIVQRYYELGVMFGEAIQIYDDLEDAFKSPANPDWLQGRNNLALLYGLTAEYPEREQFERLRLRAWEPVVLEEAQQILIRSGAVSYCVHHIIRRHQQIQTLIDELSIFDSQPILDLLANQIAPVWNLLSRLGVQMPFDTIGVSE